MSSNKMERCVQRTQIIPNRSCAADAGQWKALNQFIGFGGRRISIALSRAFSSNAAISAENAVRVDRFYCSSQDTNPFRGAFGLMKKSSCLFFFFKLILFFCLFFF